MGFNGIQLLFLQAPILSERFFSALFISYIQVGGAAMQPSFLLNPRTLSYQSSFTWQLCTLIGDPFKSCCHVKKAGGGIAVILANIISLTIVFAVPLMLVALGGMYSEHSGYKYCA